MQPSLRKYRLSAHSAFAKIHLLEVLKGIAKFQRSLEYLCTELANELPDIKSATDS